MLAHWVCDLKLIFHFENTCHNIARKKITKKNFILTLIERHSMSFNMMIDGFFFSILFISTHGSATIT